MKLNLITILLLLNSFLFGQNEQIKKELTEILYSQIQYLHKGKINKYYQFYDKKSYIHLHGGKNKDGKVNFKKEIKRTKKIFKKMRKENIKYKKDLKLPIDSLLDFKNITILNFKEFQKKYESINNYGFTMKVGDYYVLLHPKIKSYLAGAWHGGIYRKIKGKWKIVAGDL